MIRVRIGDEQLDLSWDAFEERARAGRIPPNALVQWEPVTGAEFVQADQLEIYQSLHDEQLASWQRSFRDGPPPLATALLVGVQIRIWSLTLVPSVSTWFEVQLTKWTPFTLEEGEIWRLLTMGFLHVDPTHLAMNMLWMAYTSWNLERALGWRHLVLLYLGSVAGGSLMSTWGAPGSPSLGASGGVFGLIAASVVFGLKYPDALPESSRRFFGFAMLPYLLFMFVSGLFNENTDNWCHFGGLLTGGLLATSLSPAALDRDTDRRLSLHHALLASFALSFGALLWLGPDLTALDDHDEVRMMKLRSARRDAPPPPPLDPDRYRELIYQTPVSWNPASTVDLIGGMRSPAGPRFWAVRATTTELPSTAEEVIRQRREALERAGALIQSWDPSAAEIAGVPGLRADAAFVYQGEPMRGTWWAATRGRHQLVATWQTDAARHDRFRALADRALSTLVWNDPEDLTVAEAAWRDHPENLIVTRSYASALADVGRVDEAMARWTSLLGDDPARRKAWDGLLQLLQWYPHDLPDAEQWLDRALAADAGSAVDLGVIIALEARGEPDTARALLEIAWLRAPGDRTLRRARQSRGMSTDLAASTGMPPSASYDPLTGQTRDASLRSEPGTLTEARANAALAVERRERLLQTAQQQLSAGAPELLGTLVLLARGEAPTDRLAAREALFADLQSSTTPVWHDPSLGAPAALLDHLRGLPQDRATASIPEFN